MINLLPTDFRQGIIYARRNTAMLKWSIGILAFGAGCAAIMVAGHLYMQKSINSYKTQINQSEIALKEQNLEGNQKRLEDISSSIKLVVQVLSKEVLFSKLLRQLGSVMPQNTRLEQLQIDKLQGGLTLTVRALDFQSASQVQVNLQDPANKIFEKADIESINCSPPDPKITYPCSVQIRALFLKNNPFLLITPANKGATP